MINLAFVERFSAHFDSQWASPQESQELVGLTIDSTYHQLNGLFLSVRHWPKGEETYAVENQNERCWTINRKLEPIGFDPRGGNMVATVAPTVVRESFRIPIDAWLDGSTDWRANRLAFAAVWLVKSLDETIVELESKILRAALNVTQNDVNERIVRLNSPCKGWKSMRMAPRFMLRAESDGTYFDLVTTIAFLIKQSEADEWLDLDLED